MANLDRPDGSVATPIGWMLIAIGAIGAFIAGSAESLNGTLIGFGLANLGFGLGVILLSLGYLVRAIWFLPGREIPVVSASPITERTKAYDPCDWCGRALPAGSRPCTSFDQETLTKVSDKVKDPVCKAQLQERDYPVAASSTSSEGQNG